MNVLHLNTKDTGGGAARASYRLHCGLREENINSKMLVQNKNGENDYVYGSNGFTGDLRSKIRLEADQLPVRKYLGRDPELFSPAWVPEFRSQRITEFDPDIVHLHWINGGFLRSETVANIDVPIVWTLHDMWPFTGGCHYSKSCNKYRSECSKCPHLGSNKKNDLANTVWQNKKAAWDQSDISVISPSRWLAKEARKSTLLEDKSINVIPNCINTELFKPRDRSAGIRKFNLDEKKTYILFGSSYDTPRKGGNLLHEAAINLESNKSIEALVFGNSNIRSENFPIPVHNLGYISDQNLYELYSTADVTVIPSRQDNLPNVAVESITSGTPCVAFDIGGLSDIIEHKQTGYLCDPFDTEELAKGIQWITSSTERQKRLSNKARMKGIEKYSKSAVIPQHISLYQRLI